MALKPLSDRVVVIRSAAASKSTGGLYVPNTAQEKPVEGEIIAIGMGKRLPSGEPQPLAVKVGDRVMFNKYAGTEVQMDGAEQLILREDELLAVLEFPENE